MAETPESYFVRFTVDQDHRTRFAGPFNTADEAQAAIQTALATPNSVAIMHDDTTGDESRMIRINGVMSRAEAEQAGLAEQSQQTNIVGPIVPVSLDDLSDLQMMPY